MTIQFSHSRVECFNKCAYQYFLKYVKHLKTLPNFDANNPLILGSALHKGVESGLEAGLKLYRDYFPNWSDLHEEELLKLEYWIPKLNAILPKGKHELEVSNFHFIGYLDLLAPTPGGPEKVYDLYDFKYSNNVKNYLESGQLHEYKHFYERMNPGTFIRNMYFVFVPKFFIRQKKSETVFQFRQRLYSEMAKKDIQIIKIDYDPNKVIEFYQRCQQIEDLETDGQEQWFPKNRSRLCDWCDYKKYCEEGVDFMLLPKNERRNIEKVARKRIWIYGAPFCGKTYFANKFPNVLMLNTDGNVRFVDAPFIAIKDTVQMEGRIEKRTFAWQIFKDAIEELEKKQNNYQTIVVDLLEDCYESCRLFMYDKLGISHESDDNFRAWDKVRTEFLSTMRRLLNLDYDNIILISHEDTTKDMTKKSGDKISTIKPNLSDKPALKIAGMVDIVGRIVADDDTRTLNFKATDVVFGGGRLNIKEEQIPLDVEALNAVYEEANKDLSNTKTVVTKKQVLKHETDKESTVPTEKETNNTVEQKKEQPVVPEHVSVPESKTEVTSEQTSEKPKRRVRKHRVETQEKPF
jgi:phage nucleotide-binding protein